MAWALAAACALALAAVGVVTHQLHAERAAHTQTRLEHQTLIAAAERARADEEARRRKTEQELSDVVETQAQEIAAAQQAAALARTAAVAAGQRMLSATQAAAERARAQCADSSTATAGQTADDDPIGVLADVLGRADEAAGIMGALADERGLAGRACERLYDSARDALTR